MEKNNIKPHNVYISEEEKTLNWNEIQNSFKKTFGSEIEIRENFVIYLSL